MHCYSSCGLFVLQVAIPDLVDAAANADILIFVLPHQVGGGAECNDFILATF